MTIRTHQDMCALAEHLERLAEILRDKGTQALATTSDWLPGPKSPNLDPNSRSWRYEIIEHADGTTEVVPKPADSTGEAAISHDRPGELHGRLSAALRFLESAGEEAAHIVLLACPGVAVLKADELSNAQVSAQGWCISCWRLDGYCEPVAIQPGGKRRYRDFCNWCGTWNAVHKRMPPVKLLERRRRGERITDRVIAEVLAAEKTDRKTTKKTKKRGKK